MEKVHDSGRFENIHLKKSNNNNGNNKRNIFNFVPLRAFNANQKITTANAQ